MLCFRIFDGVFVMLISVKMQTHVGILTFIIMINFVLGCFKTLIYLHVEDIYFFEVNTNYVSLSVMKNQ